MRTYLLEKSRVVFQVGKIKSKIVNVNIAPDTSSKQKILCEVLNSVSNQHLMYFLAEASIIYDQLLYSMFFLMLSEECFSGTIP